MTKRLPLIAITIGDPSGIGPEVVVKALEHQDLYERCRPFVIGSVSAIQNAVDICGTVATPRTIKAPDDARSSNSKIEVLSIDNFEEARFPIGQVSKTSALAAHAWIKLAATLCLNGTVDAMVTAPINKEALQSAGVSEMGHQEILKRLSGAPHVATMLVSGKLRCMHLSTHLPLPEACEFVSRQNILQAIRLTDTHFKRWGFALPRIAVAALNPHAGDNGLIGRHEIEQIAPAVNDAIAEGIEAQGPLAADSVFRQSLNGQYDVVLVMYHDQGHIAIKVHGFEESVSVNLGLPFIRTSVDHGTAFDIAGTGTADETSMVEAIKLAVSLATQSVLD